MPLLTIPAIFDGKDIRLLENAPVRVPYQVMVTFVNPETDKSSHDRFWSSFGAWQDDRPITDTLHDIYASRVSRSEPRAL